MVETVSDNRLNLWVIRDLEEDAPFDDGAAKVLKGANGDPEAIRKNVSYNSSRHRVYLLKGLDCSSRCTKIKSC